MFGERRVGSCRGVRSGGEGEFEEGRCGEDGKGEEVCGSVMRRELYSIGR